MRERLSCVVTLNEDLSTPALSNKSTSLLSTCFRARGVVPMSDLTPGYQGSEIAENNMFWMQGPGVHDSIGGAPTPKPSQGLGPRPWV